MLPIIKIPLFSFKSISKLKKFKFAYFPKKDEIKKGNKLKTNMSITEEDA